MQKRRDVSKLKNATQFDAMLRNVKRAGDEFILEEAGQAVAAVIPIDRYDRMQQARDYVIAFANRAGKALAGIPPEEIQVEIDAAIREVRSSRS